MLTKETGTGRDAKRGVRNETRAKRDFGQNEIDRRRNETRAKRGPGETRPAGETRPGRNELGEKRWAKRDSGETSPFHANLVCLCGKHALG